MGIAKNKQLLGALMLLLTALVWGLAFVAQSVGMELVGAFTFNGVRSLMGAAALLPVILVRDRVTTKRMTPKQLRARRVSDKKTLAGGALLGVVFCAATNFQQFAFGDTPAGKIAFITALYMFFVPLFGLFLKKRVLPLTWACVLVGFVGLYFLCVDPAALGSIRRGDVLSLICAVLFAVHILLIEKLAPDADGLKLSCVQLAVAGALSCVLMFIFETPTFEAIGSASLPLLYSGIMSCGVAYTFQIIGQKYTEATVASLLMCMESVFAVLSAALLLNETLSTREITGCAVMFAAIVLSQLSGPITERLRAVTKRREAEESA